MLDWLPCTNIDYAQFIIEVHTMGSTYRSVGLLNIDCIQCIIFLCVMAVVWRREVVKNQCALSGIKSAFEQCTL